MPNINTSVLILGFVGLSGCTSWPSKGYGGMAEHHLETFLQVMPGSLNSMHELHVEFDLVRQQLDILVLRGAKLCFPAAVKRAKQRQNRIIRQLYGNLVFDAINDLTVQRKRLERLERQLNYVKKNKVCLLPKTTAYLPSVTTFKRLFDLLNSDNQFAFDSSVVNPKYLNHLTQAAKLLKNHPYFNLRITGHADAKGTEQHNQKLSLKRAKTVAQYLQSLGISNERIECKATGSEKPLFNGKEPHIRLVNRRVNIQLIDASGYIFSTKG